MNYKSYEDLPLLLSVEQLIEVLGIGRTTAYELIRSGEIRSIRVGHQIRIPKEAVVSFIKA